MVPGNLFGVGTRRTVLTIESILLLGGVFGWMASGEAYFGACFFFSAYLTGRIVRYGGDHRVWKNSPEDLHAQGSGPESGAVSCSSIGQNRGTTARTS